MTTLHPEGALVCSVREWTGDYFSRDVPGGVETTPVRSALWCIKADGSDRRPVPLPGERVEHPLASRDGGWIYFQSEAAGRWSIQRVRPDGGGLMKIAPNGELDDGKTSAFGAALSGDGRQLTFTLHAGGAGRVVQAQPDGRGARVLAPDFGYTYMAAPDGRAERVVFSGPARDYRLVMMEGPGGIPRVLTPDHPDSYMPQFTPDGSAIIFIRRDGGLYRVAPDGTGLQRLADNVQVEFFLSPQDAHGSTDVPAISPDGTRVAFVRTGRGAGAQVAVVDCGGKNLRMLTNLPGVCGRVGWPIISTGPVG